MVGLVLVRLNLTLMLVNFPKLTFSYSIQSPQLDIVASPDFAYLKVHYAQLIQTKTKVEIYF